MGRRIVVAWKDTREARRAVREAWPFLRNAEAVSIVTVGSDAEALGANDISDALEQRGIRCRAVLVDKIRSRVSAEILRIAAEEKADLLVAGAYGQARVHEFIYGSVTRDLLEASPISCFLSR
ncbi:universal stress protein [Methylobacterium sp. P31]